MKKLLFIAIILFAFTAQGQSFYASTIGQQRHEEQKCYKPKVKHGLKYKMKRNKMYASKRKYMQAKSR